MWIDQEIWKDLLWLIQELKWKNFIFYFFIIIIIFL